MARTKRVFGTDEIAHLWAHKTQEDARNGQGNFYFDGDTIYSYGSHFPIARHVTNAQGQAAILFTNRSYSNTTAKHVGIVRRAIPHGVPVFEVHNPAHDTAMEYRTQRADVEALIKKLQAARPDNRYEYKVKTSKQKVTWKHKDGTEHEHDAVVGRNVAMYETGNQRGGTVLWNVAPLHEPNTGTAFTSGVSRAEARIILDITDSIKTWDISTDAKRDRLFKRVQKARATATEYASISRNPGTLAKQYSELEVKVQAVNALGEFFAFGPTVKVPDDLVYLEAVRDAHHASTAARANTTRAQRDARWAKQNAEAVKDFEEKLPRWLAGEHVSLPFRYSNEAYLRVDGNEVQTSQGARVPLEHVRKALPVVLAYVQNGREYHRNGHTIHLGHYAIDSIDAQGNLRAGCHLFNKAEIERFAGVLEALPAPEPLPDLPDPQTKDGADNYDYTRNNRSPAEG